MHIDKKEFRKKYYIDSLIKSICDITTKPWHIMEICGGQTHAIAQYGIEEFLPDNISLIHGPGCPVCVTPVSVLDKAIALSQRPDTIVCTFGDMMRVPGSETDLLKAKAQGGDIRLVYSPLDSLQTAKDNPNKEVVFFAIGFETTAPVHAACVKMAQQENISNFSLLTSLFTVPEALQVIIDDPESNVDGVLAAGHVCAVMGLAQYENLSRNIGKPIVVTGFEPADLLYGIYRCVEALESNTPYVYNAYARSVATAGNTAAQYLLREIFETTDKEWRGLGNIPNSGLRLRKEYEQYNAIKRFNLENEYSNQVESECASGRIMKGISTPFACIHFGSKCTPEHPIGAPMVSSEGVCSAYYKYRLK